MHVAQTRHGHSCRPAFFLDLFADGHGFVSGPLLQLGLPRKEVAV